MLNLSMKKIKSTFKRIKILFSFVPQIKAYTFCFGICQRVHTLLKFSALLTLQLLYFINVFQVFYKLLLRAPDFQMTASAYPYVAM